MNSPSINYSISITERICYIFLEKYHYKSIESPQLCIINILFDLICISLVQSDVPEGRSGQQVIDSLQRKIEQAGGQRNGNWLVECETYYSSQSQGE